MADEARDYEAEAKEQGYNPNYDGDNKVDAKTFVERGEKFVGIANSKLRRLEEKFQVLEASNQAMLAANKDFGAYKEGQLAKEKQKSANLLAELETRRATAINEADGVEFTKVDREIQQVRDDIKEPAPQLRNETDVLGQAWLLNNDWYNTNRKMRLYTDAISEEVVASGFVGGSAAYYAELTRLAKADFPEEFESKQTKPAGVEQGGTLEVKSDSEDHTYENLPAEDRAACDRFIAAGHTTKESYCASYDW